VLQATAYPLTHAHTVKNIHEVSYIVSKERKCCSPESRATKEQVCVISGFRRGVNEIFALLGCYGM
jgi:hypothetical protein